MQLHAPPVGWPGPGGKRKKKVPAQRAWGVGGSRERKVKKGDAASDGDHPMRHFVVYRAFGEHMDRKASLFWKGKDLQ